MDIASLSRGGAFKSEETGLESRGGGLSQADQMHIMKYMQLKYTVLFLQKQKFVGRYCFYGEYFRLWQTKNNLFFHITWNECCLAFNFDRKVNCLKKNFQDVGACRLEHVNN